MSTIHPWRQTFAVVAVALFNLSPAQAQSTPAEKLDLFGDPLPAGALVRLGTLRFTHCRVAAYAPDGKILAVAGEHEVSLWDAPTYKLIRRLKNSKGVEANGVTFSPDGKLLAVNGFAGANGDIWDLRTFEGKPFVVDTERSGSFDWGAVAAFESDGKTLRIATNRTVAYVDTKSGKLLQQVRYAPDKNAFTKVVLSPDGTLVASIYFNVDTRSIYVSDARTGKQRHILKERSDQIESFRFTPDSRRLAVATEIFNGADRGRLLRFWDLSNGQAAESFRLPSRTTSLTFSKDGKTLVTSQEAERISFDVSRPPSICVWDLKSTEKPVHRFDAFGISDVILSPDGKTIAWRCCNETLRLVDVAGGKEVNTLNSHRGTIRSLKFSPDGKALASAGDDGSVRIWDAASGKQLAVMHGHASEVNAVAYSPDGTILASGGTDHKVVIWDARTGAKLRTLPEHGNEVRDVAFSSSGKVLAAGGYYRVFLWDPGTGAKIEELEFNSKGLAISPDEQRIFAAQPFKKGVVFYDRKSKADRRIQTTNATTSLALSADGKVLAVGCNMRTPLLDSRSGKELFTVPGHYNERGQVAFSPDGRYLASVGDGYHFDNNPQTIQVFEVLTGKEIHRFERRYPVFAVAFSPDGRRLATGGADTTALIWDLHNLTAAEHPSTLLESSLAAYWKALADPDPARAYAARVAMIHAPKSATEYLAKKLEPRPSVNEARVKEWILELDDKSFQKREAANKQLGDLALSGELAESVLNEARGRSKSEEVNRRLDNLVAQISPIPQLDPDQLREVRCIEILEYANTPAARDMLQRMAKGNPHSYVTRESIRTLARIARAGKE